MSGFPVTQASGLPAGSKESPQRGRPGGLRYVQLRKYRDQFSGMTAHVVQRATGLLLLVYLFLHVHTIRELSKGPVAFNAALAQFRSPLFKLLEIALFGIVILHALNGIRLTILDLGLGHEKQRRLFWVYTIGAGALIFLAGAIPLLVNLYL